MQLVGCSARVGGGGGKGLHTTCSIMSLSFASRPSILCSKSIAQEGVPEDAGLVVLEVSAYSIGGVRLCMPHYAKRCTLTSVTVPSSTTLPKGFPAKVKVEFTYM